MPGVNRPTTLTDVIAVLNDQSSQSQGNDVINGLGQFGETDETFPIVDAMTTVVQVNPGWDQGTWGGFTWS